MNLYVRQHDHKWITTILFWAILVGCVDENVAQTGFKCFTCASNAQDLTCLNDPSHVSSGSATVTCDQDNGQFGWCAIVRQEYADIPGSIVNFNRLCLKTEPALLDEVITDDKHTFFYRTCRTHLCNDGDGIDSISGSGGLGGGKDDEGVIRVSPERSWSTSIHSPSSLIVPLAMAFMIMTYNFIRTP